MRTRHEQAAYWVIEVDVGLSYRQRKRFRRWLEDPENAETYRAMRASWERTGKLLREQYLRRKAMH